MTEPLWKARASGAPICDFGDGLLPATIQLCGLNSRAKQINLKLDAVSAIYNVADIDRFAGVVDDDQVTLNGRRAERDLHEVSNFWTRAADQQSLVRIAQGNVVTGIDG